VKDKLHGQRQNRHNLSCIDSEDIGGLGEDASPASYIHNKVRRMTNTRDSTNYKLSPRVILKENHILCTQEVSSKRDRTKLIVKKQQTYGMIWKNSQPQTSDANKFINKTTDLNSGGGGNIIKNITNLLDCDTNCSIYKEQLYRERYLSQLDLSPRQLFKTETKRPKSCVISPPKSEHGCSMREKGFDNPWSFQSPIMIETDNFRAMDNKREDPSEVEKKCNDFSHPLADLKSPVAVSGRIIEPAHRTSYWTKPLGSVSTDSTSRDSGSSNFITENCSSVTASPDKSYAHPYFSYPKAVLPPAPRYGPTLYKKARIMSFQVNNDPIPSQCFCARDQLQESNNSAKLSMCGCYPRIHPSTNGIAYGLPHGLSRDCVPGVCNTNVSTLPYENTYGYTFNPPANSCIPYHLSEWGM